MSSRARAWLLGFGVWTLLALLSASQSAVRLQFEGLVIHWDRVVTGALVGWYSCAIFTPIFFLAARRFPIDAARWARHLPIHLGLCAGASVLKYGIEWFTMARVLGYPGPPLSRMVLYGFISENIAFWCMAGIIHAIEFQRRAREREVLTARLQARLSGAQLAALGARLQPHFLFNTLQGVSTLVHRDPDAADAMLGHLSTLLRTMLQGRPGHEVTLAEELQLADEYLAIVQVRFGDRVKVTRDIDESVREALVPHLLLQPLLENAFEHGIARRAAAGRVEITARAEAGRLLLSVRDDGYGPGDGAEREGVGLGATRSRLAELYGEAACLALEPVPAGGTLATVELPYHLEPVVPAGDPA